MLLALDFLLFLLYPTVQVFFKRHPRREEIGVSDKIEILQLETRGRSLEQEVLKQFKQHAAKLEKELQVAELLPHLQKQHVLSADEVEDLSKEKGSRQSQMLLECVGEKTPFWVVRFAECLRESPGNKQLSELLLPGNGHAAAKAMGIVPYLSHSDASRENKGTVLHKKGNLKDELCCNLNQCHTNG